MVMVQVVGFVEDEKTFKILNFLKNKLHNCLTTHMKLVVQMNVQKTLYIGDIPPCVEAIDDWKGQRYEKPMLVAKTTFNVACIFHRPIVCFKRCLLASYYMVVGRG